MTPVKYPKASQTSARSTNKTGQISGWYEDASSKFRGFVKTGNIFQPINYPGATATFAYHMNGSGQVAGW